MIRFNSKSDKYGWLSNMYKSPVVVPITNEEGFSRDITFSCVEAAFQGCKVLSGLGKTKRHPEQEIRQFESFASLDGFKAREKGRTVDIPDLETWNTVRVPIMKYLVSLKYKNPEMKERLLATKGEGLVEDSPWDTFWGTKDGVGENYLGRITMDVRRTLEREAANIQMADGPKAFYAGVGSRRTPPEVLEYMKDIAGELEKKGYILQSGGAEGADSAFASGVKDPRNIRAVTPRFGYCRGRVSYQSTPEGFSSVDFYHPRPSSLSSFQRSLMERNYYQVMGNPSAGMNKVDFVACWAPVKPDGSEQYFGYLKDEYGEPLTDEKGRKIPDPRNTGGTGQAIRIAMANKVPIYNFYLPGVREKFEKEILGIEKTHKENAGNTPLESSTANRQNPLDENLELYSVYTRRG